MSAENARFENSYDSNSSEEEIPTHEENVRTWQLHLSKLQQMSFLAGFNFAIHIRMMV